MDSKKYRFPEVCYGCYDSCSNCTRRTNGYLNASIRELVAARMMKINAVKRMERDIASIENKLDEMNYEMNYRRDF